MVIWEPGARYKLSIFSISHIYPGTGKGSLHGYSDGLYMLGGTIQSCGLLELVCHYRTGFEISESHICALSAACHSRCRTLMSHTPAHVYLHADKLLDMYIMDKSPETGNQSQLNAYKR